MRQPRMVGHVLRLASLFTGIFVSARAWATSPLEIRAGDLHGVHVGDLVLQIDDTDRSVLPARIEPFAIGESHKLTVHDESYVFTVTITRSYTGYTTSSPTVAHCDPIGAEWHVNGSKLTMDVKKTGGPDCGSYPATGAPDGRGKIEFSSNPTGATLYYPKISQAGYLTAPTPTTLVVNYQTNGPVIAVMKLAGYYDCAIALRFSGPASARTINDSRHTEPIAADGTAAHIRCDLKPVTSN